MGNPPVLKKYLFKYDAFELTVLGADEDDAKKRALSGVDLEIEVNPAKMNPAAMQFVKVISNEEPANKTKGGK